jgi:hypothetical protein
MKKNSSNSEDSNPIARPINGIANNTSLTNPPSAISKAPADEFRKPENSFASVGNQFPNHMASNSSSDYTEGNSVNSKGNNTLNKAFSDLSKREAEIQGKVKSGSATTSDNEELAKLRQQIADLQTQIDSNKKIKNSDVQKSDFNTNTAASSSNGAFPQVANQNALRIAPPDSASRAATLNSNPFSLANDSQIDRTGSLNPAIKNGTISSATSIPKGAEGTASKVYGIVLMKNGEPTDDLSKVADNPKETDLLLMIEKSNGSPFVIKENGQYLTVVPEMKDGKVVFLNGKPKLIKKKIDKNKAMLSALRKDALKQDSVGALRQADTVVPNFRLKEFKDAQNAALEANH